MCIRDRDLTAKYGVSTYLKMIRLGLPMSSQRLLFTLVSIFLAKMITSFGTEAIAAQKIGLQIESITYMVIGGLNGAIASFVGQNYGAKLSLIHISITLTDGARDANVNSLNEGQTIPLR